LRLKRSAGPLELEVAARGVGLEPDLARDRDLEVHGDTAAPEEIGPAAILFVEVRLHSDVVALLVHPHLHVLEQSLRALLARAANALARLHLDLAVLADGDLRVARDVPDVQPREVADAELTLDQLRVLLATDVREVAEVEVEAHRIADGPADVTAQVAAEAGVEAAADLVAKGATFVARPLALLAVGLPLRIPLLLAEIALLAAHLALLLAHLVVPLAGLLEFLAGRPAAGPVLVAHRSASSSVAASSGAIVPSASSRRISLRRSVSRSGSACDGNPSARITASSRARTVG